MAKRKRPKKKIAISGAFRHNPEFVYKKTVIKKRVSVSWTFNPSYREDMQRFTDLFRNQHMPMYFRRLRNGLKNANKVEEIFQYAELYLQKQFLIKDIEAVQMRRKVILVPKPGPRIVRKK